jgi:rubredoxin
MTPALLTLLLFVAVLLAQQGPAQAFSTSLSRFAQKHALGRPHLEIMARETSLSMAEASPSKAGGAEPFKKFACRSCSYVYDEEKGFKKRYPPGMCVYVIQCTVTPLPPLLQIRNEAHASLSTHLPISPFYPSLHLSISPSPRLVPASRLCFSGTLFSSLKVFMCPVCGAAIDQFDPVTAEE